jgi:hypothetical protein
MKSVTPPKSAASAVPGGDALAPELRAMIASPDLDRALSAVVLDGRPWSYSNSERSKGSRKSPFGAK